MKLYYFLLILILSGCSTQENRTEERNIKASLESNVANEKKEIEKLFDDWKHKQITEKNFFAKDSCNRDYYFIGDSLNENAQYGIGFPEESDIYFKFGNLNNDSIIDALIYFIPVSCDGSKVMHYMRYEILILSGKNGYDIEDEYFNGLNKGQLGYYHWDSIAEGKIFGTYFESTEDDPLCCPSIQKSVNLDLDSKKINILMDKL